MVVTDIFLGLMNAIFIPEVSPYSLFTPYVTTDQAAILKFLD
jgi:hypothetical protein